MEYFVPFHFFNGSHVTRLVSIRRLALALSGLLARRVNIHHMRALLEHKTSSSLTTVEDSTLCRCRNVLILSVDVVLGLLASLVTALLARVLTRCF